MKSVTTVFDSGEGCDPAGEEAAPDGRVISALRRGDAQERSTFRSLLPARTASLVSSGRSLFSSGRRLLGRPGPRAARNLKAALGAFALAIVASAIGKGFYFVAIAHRAGSAFHASAVWGALVLASFAGWGSGLNALVFPRQRADWGLRCAWGWGIALASGGTLCAFGLARRRALEIFIALGLLLLVASLARANALWAQRPLGYSARRIWRDAPYLLGAAAVFALGATLYLQSILDRNFNGNDEGVAYFGFAREILEGGTLSQPFSFRRLSVYGGKSLLDAIQMVVDVPYAEPQRGRQGARRSHGARARGRARRGGAGGAPGRSFSLTLLLVVWLPDTRVNTGAQMTGAVFFFGLYRTMTWPPVKPANGWRSALPIALLAAGACTLRQNYLPSIGVLLIVAYGSEIVRAVRTDRVAARAALADAAATAGLLVLFLAPWWALSQRWVGSFLFPIVKGNYNAAYGLLDSLNKFEWLHYVWTNVGHCLPVKGVPIFLAAALSMRDRGRRKPFFALGVAAVVGFAMLIVSFPDSDAANNGRYYFGFTFPAILAICLAAADLAADWRLRARGDSGRIATIALVVVGLGVQLYEDRDARLHAYDGFLSQLQPAFDSPPAWERSVQPAAYKAVQDAVPAHEPVGAMVDSACELDYARNRIELFDIVGAVGPGQGLPLLDGPEAVASYLLSKGYRYVIVVHPDTAKTSSIVETTGRSSCARACRCGSDRPASTSPRSTTSTSCARRAFTSRTRAE